MSSLMLNGIEMLPRLRLSTEFANEQSFRLVQNFEEKDTH